MMETREPMIRSQFFSSFGLLVAVACGGVVEGPSAADGGAGIGGSSGRAVSSGGSSSTGGKLNGTGGTTGAGGKAISTGSQPSCQDLAANCGPGSNESCCNSPLVPGGTFYRSYDNVNAGYTSQAYVATISDVRLDKYEITVGRFRKFVAAYSQNMIPAGRGKDPNNPSDSGWDTAWNTSLAADSAALKIAVSCDDSYQTWTDTPQANEARPINCLSWFEAFAFCAWDGGRLPTEAEWNYAAAGGSEQRVYPWGSTAPDDSYAVFCGASCSAAENVGSKSPTGDGKWGQADLAGNVYEWLLDWYAHPYSQVSCKNCADTAAAAGRVFRGGAFSSAASGLLSSARDGGGPGDHGGGIGSRCARTP
jgi:sulfatase modifying factor 1